jgi:hypothetical protein
VFVCETWSVTLREEHRVKMFENRVLRTEFGPKKEKITRYWRKQRIIRVIKSRSVIQKGHVVYMGQSCMYGSTAET